MATDVTDEDVFRIRVTARLRTRTSVAPLPEHITVHADGSAVAADQDGDRLMRYESVGECLVDHDLVAIDLEPID
ncbi:MAG: hypothetical protein ABI175_16840 [Polyangiales bacterium]